MKRVISSSLSKNNPQGKPPKALIQSFRNKFEYDVDDYYGYVFKIDPKELNYAIERADKFGFGLVSDPDNDDWYYLQMRGE